MYYVDTYGIQSFVVQQDTHMQNLKLKKEMGLQ